MERPLILSPAGSFEALAAALNGGCDAVYFGVQQLNMRARSSHNFTLEEMEEVVARCAEKGAKAYVTLNTILYDHDLNLMRSILDAAKKAGVSAAIVQDVAAMQYALEIGLPAHASTQLSISNYESVKFYSRFVETVVLAREVDLPMIQKICEQIRKEKLTGPTGLPVKIEVFVHGALCIAQSGRCQMSLLSFNTSAQRGACLQECRKKYRIIDDETGMEMVVDNQYVMSPRDLCALPFLDQIVAAGVGVLKIEGRGRQPEYVDTVTRVYRQAADAIIEGSFSQEKVTAWMSQLQKVYNRGFTSGYYLGKMLPDFSGYPGNRATEEKFYVGDVLHYYPQARAVHVKIRAHELSIGSRVAVIGRTTGVVYGKVTDLRKDDAPVETSGKQCEVTFPLEEKVRQNDKIYIFKDRIAHETP